MFTKLLKSLLLSWIILVAGCGSPTSPGPTPTAVIPTPTRLAVPVTLTVFAASSLLEAFTGIGKAFEAANPGVTVVFNFDGSQSLRAQIENGATPDLFASANQQEINLLLDQSRIAPYKLLMFAINQLIVILPPSNPANLQSLADLAQPGLTLALGADGTPIGNYSRQALDNLNALYGADFSANVLANVVFSEDNVKQVVAQVQLGEADAGIVYISDAVAAPDLKTLPIPAEYNVTATYPIAVLANTPQLEIASKFAAYMYAQESQAILRKWGFSPLTP